MPLGGAINHSSVARRSQPGMRPDRMAAGILQYRSDGPRHPTGSVRLNTETGGGLGAQVLPGRLVAKSVNDMNAVISSAKLPVYERIKHGDVAYPVFCPISR